MCTSVHWAQFEVFFYKLWEVLDEFTKPIEGRETNLSKNTFSKEKFKLHRCQVSCDCNKKLSLKESLFCES